MSSYTSPIPLSLASDDDIRAVRESFKCAGFTEAGILSRLEVEAMPLPRRLVRERDKYVASVSGNTPVEVLTRLFVLAMPVSRSEFVTAVAPSHTALWQRLGLVAINAEQVGPMVGFGFCGGRTFAADLERPAVGIDPVMPIAASSTFLDQMRIQRPVRETLDLGTGCGVLAVLASANSETVLGTDSNVRAVSFARLNAALNDIHNAQFATGNLFEPVTGRRFDLILCNPPFVIAPAGLAAHTSTGGAGDAFCRTVVRSAPTFLNEGGYAQVICNWAELRGEDPIERVQSWYRGQGCDGWVLHSHAEEASAYASARIDELGLKPTDAAKRFDEWMAYFNAERIVAVHFGIVTLRRRTGSNWERYDQIPGAVGECGNSILNGFETRDLLDATDDATLLHLTLASAPDLTVTRQGDRNGKLRIQLSTGLTFGAAVDRPVVELITNFGSGATLAALIEGERDPNARAGIIAVTRQLLAAGFLVRNALTPP